MSYARHPNDLLDSELSRVTEMRKAIQAAHDALKANPLWAFNEANPPNELTAKWADGSASMTHGPNNCRDFFELRKKALEMLEKVLANQLATPSE